MSAPTEDPTDLANLMMATSMIAEMKNRPYFKHLNHDKCVEVFTQVFGLTVEQIEFALKENP